MTGRPEQRKAAPGQGTTRLWQVQGTLRPCAAEVTSSSAATRGAAPHPPRHHLHPLLSEPKKPLTRGLTEIPGPCCRSPEVLRPGRRCAGLTRGQRRGAPSPPGAEREPALRTGRSSGRDGHQSAANENRMCWRRRGRKQRRKEVAASPQRRPPAGGRATPAAPAVALAGIPRATWMMRWSGTSDRSALPETSEKPCADFYSCEPSTATSTLVDSV